MKFVLFLIFLILGSCQTPERVSNLQRPSSKYPVLVRGDAKSQILDYEYFLVSFNPESELPNWVYYEIDAKNLKFKNAKRKNRFKYDFRQNDRAVNSVVVDPYKGSGYDRGHMAPSGDFVFNQEANDRTFYMSNIAPQKPKLNRGSWKKLENKVRAWACNEKTLVVVTGPILKPEQKKQSAQLLIPESYFKVIMSKSPPIKAIGFVYFQDHRLNNFKNNVRSVNEIEKLTGLDLFSDLDDLIEEKIESDKNISRWKSQAC